MNKVDGRLNRLLVHASSALQNGIQVRSERGDPTFVWPEAKTQARDSGANESAPL
jgi:hypothetical protein